MPDPVVEEPLHKKSLSPLETDFIVESRVGIRVYMKRDLIS